VQHFPPKQAPPLQEVLSSTATLLQAPELQESVVQGLLSLQLRHSLPLGPQLATVVPGLQIPSEV
jgi:hypothetical protein